jgi:hypothetical protein
MRNFEKKLRKTALDTQVCELQFYSIKKKWFDKDKYLFELILQASMEE